MLIIFREEKCGGVYLTLSLISTHTFRLSPAKFFALDMHKLMKPIELNEKISFVLFTFEVQIFQLLRNFLPAKPIRFLS